MKEQLGYIKSQVIEWGGGGKKSKRARKNIRAKKSQEREENSEHDHFKVLFYLRVTLYNPQSALISRRNS